MLSGPEMDVNSIEKAEEGETPGDAIDNDDFTTREPLVDDRAKE